MSFVAELKQRKVVRVALVYLVVAWIAIQVVSIVLPAFNAPAWAMRVVILLFALGFPLALLLTWALEWTPEGIKLATSQIGSKRMAGIAAGLLALAIGWFFLGQPALRHQAMASERSIAVLPFVNMSGDKANEYFSDGLAETTLDMLAQVKDLKVIARTSSFAFKGKATDMREIGKTLGVAHLLEGSVQQAGDTVRITVQLIRVADGSHLWSRRFDRRLTDVFKVQDEIATEVVQALQVALPAGEQQRLTRKRTDNIAAYKEFLKGSALIQDRKIPEVRKAIAHFERAIALDPGYARAYVAAAHSFHILQEYASITTSERQRGARYLERALDLAPELGEAHITRGDELLFANNLAAAEREYRRGIELAPGFANGYRRLGELLGNYWRFDEALPLLDRAVALDPLSLITQDRRLYYLAAAGRSDEALVLSNQLIDARPDIPENYVARAAVFRLRGDPVAALRDHRTLDRLDPDAVGHRAGRCTILRNMGALAEARDCAAAIARSAPGSNAALEVEIGLAAAVGDFPAALVLVGRMQPPDELLRARMLMANGQATEALALYRRLRPGLFSPTVSPLVPTQASDAIRVGIALIETGATAEGRSLLNRANVALTYMTPATWANGRGWWDAIAHAQLGEQERAFAALQAAVERGYAEGLVALDSNPLTAGLRADPRYNRILAPSRAKAAAQVEAARKAGLL